MLTPTGIMPMMVAVPPRAEFNNALPPTVPMLALALAQFGLMLLAAEPRIEAAVLGLFGIGPVIAPAAEQLRCAVAFVQQRDDELYPRAATDALFERLGSPRKQHLSSPGGHDAVPAAGYEEAVGFLARHLSPPRAGP